MNVKETQVHLAKNMLLFKQNLSILQRLYVLYLVTFSKHGSTLTLVLHM